MENIWLFFSICLVYSLSSVGKASVFQDGFDHHYVYKAKSDFLGVQNVTTIIKFHIQHQNVSKTGDQLNTLWVDSFVQFTQSGQYADNPKKWNLSRPFLFTVSPKGIVLHAFVHSEEEDEVLTLKKVISSTFSANVTIQNDTKWTYSSTDSDHIGTLPHEYTGTRTDSGIRLSRYHRSVEHVERIHAKTLHIDKYGTIEIVEGEDNIILENRLDSNFNSKRIPYPDNTTEEGGIGVIKINAEINMKLLSKRRIRQKSERIIFHGLRLDNVFYQKKKQQKESYASLEANIKAAIKCCHQYSDKSNTNRTICVNNLRQNITSLNEKDYETAVSEFLSKECEANDTKCEDERLLFTDIVAREGSELSQKIVVKYLFQRRILDEEAIRRSLIHFTTLVNPTTETVTAVKKLCFGEKNEHHGAVNMTVMVRRSCLALGSLAKALRKNGNDTAALAILENLHTWLYKQGDETPEHLRPRRSTINVDSTVSDDHLLSKFVLLHSLGNAAHPSSLKHLHEYATPNSRVPAWRRAALTAMTYDKGNKTAQVFLDSLAFDKTETVRSIALEQFLAHPLQKNYTKHLGDTLLSQNYTYPTVVRLKRALDLNTALLEFKLGLPDVKWAKPIGNDDVGASFGVDMVNNMHLRIHPLNSFFHLNIWDRIYAEMHVGILNIRVDILYIDVCYRGKIGYNLNILKDFSFGEAQRDFDEFSREASSILSPIFHAVDGITTHFKASAGQQRAFQPLIDAVRSIPVQAFRTIESSNNLLAIIKTYQGLPLVSKARRFAFRLQGLVEDIRSDTLNFQNEIADIALISLPHAETQMTEATNMISQVQRKIGSYPQQGFETINMAKQRIKYATYQFLKAKSAIQNVLSPHGGSLPSWLSSKDEIQMAISNAESLLSEIKSAQEHFATLPTKDANNFVKWQRLTDIKHALSRAAADLKNLNANVNPLHTVLTDSLKKMQNIKLSVDEMDKKTKETQSFIKQIFGPKFNVAFPAKRREQDYKCGKGIWPSTTGGRYSDYPGVDVIVNENEKVVNPVNGRVFRTRKDGEVRITPLDDNFKMFTILIRNIRLGDFISANGSEMKAGQTIGHGKGKNGCSEPYIHVAMSRKEEDGSSKCSFVDPTAYLVNKIKPFSSWEVECKTFIFKHIGNIIDAGFSGFNFEDIVDNFIKRALQWAGTYLVKEILSHLPDSPVSSIIKDIAHSSLSQLNCEITETFMQSGSQSEIGNEKRQDSSTSMIGQLFSTGKQHLSEMMKNLQGTSFQNSARQIQDIVRRIKSATGGIKLDDITSMAFSRYGKILDKLNVPYKGSKQSTETVIQMLTWNVCPTFENGIAQGYGHLCIPSNDCFGLNCTIHIPDGIKKETLTLAVQFNRIDSTFMLVTRNYDWTIAVDGTHHQYNFEDMLPNHAVTILSHTNSFNVPVGKAFQLTLSAVVCNKYAQCLPEVHIFEKLTFFVQLHSITSTTDDCILGANVDINKVGHFGGSLHLDSTGRVSGGNLDNGFQVGEINVGGQFHINSHGEWDINVEANMDLFDETTLETSMSFEGKSEEISFGLGVEAEIGEGKSIGGFIDSNLKGDISSGLHGNMNFGPNYENKKGKLSASFKTSSEGTIDASVSGSAQIGNSTLSGVGYIHHTKDETSSGGTMAGKINKNGKISTSLNTSSKGITDVGASGSVKISNSSISGSGYLHKHNNGTSGRGKIDAVINNNGQIPASLIASSDDKIYNVVNGSTQIENSNVTKDSISREATIATHHVNVRNADNCRLDFTADVGKDGIEIGGNTNVPGFGKMGANVEIKDGQLSGKINIGDVSIGFGDLGKMTMDFVNQLASDFNINSDTTGVISMFRDGIKNEMCSFEAMMTVGFKTEMFEEDSPAQDKKDGVNYPDKYVDATFFYLPLLFNAGPIGILFEFGAGGAVGTSMWSDIHAMRGDATVSVSPWASGLVWGAVSIHLGFISGGVKLKGYILKTKFPITMETNSTKHPLTVVYKIDVELTPIELRLYVWVKVFFIKVFDKCVWKWACTPIKWNILTREKRENDKSQPKFVTSSFCGDQRRKREVNKCSVRQIPNRHPSDTAFQLEVSATDDDSGVNTWFAIGTSPGEKDVKVWTKFKGNNQIVPSKMPNGVPLYFTIKAQNEQGLSSYVQCKLGTYDNTLPDGRVEASHKFSSHPKKIGATVIVSDDSTITSTSKALGLSPGQYGSEIVDWKSLSLSKTTIRSGISLDLKHFSSPRKGKLIVKPIEFSISEYSETCAKKCLKMAQCISFSYEQQSETCELYDVVESHTNQLYVKDDFYNYERLGGGYSSYIEYQNQPFEHGTVYYVNVFVENSLGYHSTLFSEGTLIDFTPPVPGHPGNVSRDVTVSHRCKSSVRQRCEQVTDLPNHRIVVDGPDGKTVFNGNKPFHDTKFTLTNHYVTANWDGFADPESGIWGYAWAVGTKLCGDDIVKFEDPYKHIPSPNHWTSTGFHDNLDLKDGEYYATVEALNNVLFGGALVTTVCHSVPFLVDTTPPEFHNITDVMFDEDFDILAAYYNVSDRESGITRVDFGLGMTKHDVELRAYSRHDFMERNDPYLVIEHLELTPGIPAWVRLRAVNKVDLFAAGHAKEPIIVDKTPPISGIVLDGYTLREDLEYQHDTEQICAQWQDFFDPESGINRFIWGVGTQPQKDDIVPFKNMSKFVRHACVQANLRHNVTYFSTVVAINDALNTKRSNSSSNGVLVDITPPFPGKVDDRSVVPDFTDDIDYTSETATILASWQDFYDPESGIDHYDINVEINNETAKFLPLSTDTVFEDHSFTIHHLDFIQVEVCASNGAKLQTSLRSDGVLVDHTPPYLHYVYDTKNGNNFQSDNTKLYLKWEFSDLESGLAEYRYLVKEINSGITRTIYPEHGDLISIDPQPQMVSIEIENLHLKNGALYKVHVIAVNKARLSSSHLSAGVLIDTTPPIVKNVKLALPDEEEDLDETDTYVLHAGTGPLTISWLTRDSQSGIREIKVGVGNVSGDTSLTKGFIVLSNGETHTSIRDLNLRYYEEDSPVLYYASVVAVNKAGLESNLVSSKPIKVLKENVPGTVFDGRQDLQDIDYTNDKTSLGISFAGFESKACNIVSYEWAVGSEPYLTDILPFTDYGIVMINESKGHAHINIELKESQIYFATVRARTGQMCKEEFIMSASDGITFDSKEPEIKLRIKNNKKNSQEVGYQSKSIYQQTTENLDISWEVTDLSGIVAETWSIGSLPEREDIYNLTESNGTGIPLNSVSLHAGTAHFVTVRAKDKAGNQAVMTSPAFIVDTSVPEIDGFSCTKVFSSAKSLLSCKWLFLSEKESTIISLSYGISSSPLALDILHFTEIPVERRGWYRNIADYIVNADIEKIYMSLRVKNSAGHVFITEETAIFDRTPPFNGTVKIITRDSFTSTNIATICQLSQQYVEIEVKGFTDEESSLSRLEIGLGSDAGKTDIRPFAKFDIEEHILIDGLQLIPGMAVFATVNVYNDVNLYSTTLSQGMVISPSPMLTVLDGDGQKDEDYLSDLNIIQGRWEYTDHCPITKAEWAIRDLLGNNIQEFIPILNANTHFINDELRTENGHKYINIIRTTDALNRTRIAYSDGITVRIQPPKFANVRDGLESEDINYQRSVSELTGNWDEFGDHSSEHPSQLILKYEVAVGDDIRFPNTRTNIHPFVNVGLNRTIVFKKLKLVAKTSRYFLTVRAFSAAGSFVEGYSNGIQVGYEDTINPGDLKYDAFQSSYQNIIISWSDFISDYSIRQYEVAVSTVTPKSTNDTVDCSVLKSDVKGFDIKQLSSVGLNTVTNITGLSLLHGRSYFVTILAENEAQSCIAVTSGPILIDTSEPVVGNVFLNNRETGTKYNFINSPTLKVSWDNFSDSESGICCYHVLLAEQDGCGPGSSSRYVVQEESVNITEVTFYQLQEEKKYIIKVTVTNKANLSSTITTASIFLDKKRPLIGHVKVGVDWKRPVSVQHSSTTLNGTILITRTQDGYTCPLQKDFSPSSNNLFSTWHPLAGDFTPKCISVTNKGLIIEVKTDEHIFSEIVKGGVQTNEMEIKDGLYTFRMTVLRGENMVTSVSILRENSAIPLNFSESLDDINDTSEQYKNDTSSNESSDGMKKMSAHDHYGTGFLVPGYRIRNETNIWNILFWAADSYDTKLAWVEVDFDPSDKEAKYDISLMKKNETSTLKWNIKFSVNDEEKATINAMTFQNKIRISVEGYNKNGYVPDVEDIFNPFYSEIKLSSVYVPRQTDTPCRYGKPFFDGEGGIHEIWAGASNSQNETETLVKYALQKTYCLPCKDRCHMECDVDCSVHTNEPLEIIYITLSNLTMLPSSNISLEMVNNISSGSDFSKFSTDSYYINIKVVDFAGNFIEAISEAVIIDDTPPKFIQMSCVDPSHSLDEPTLYQGTNSSVAAFWECEDDISQITEYMTCVGSSAGRCDIKPLENIGPRTSVLIEGLSGLLLDGYTYFVTVTAYNAAGLKTSESCNITVQLQLPETSRSESKEMFSIPVENALPTVAFSDRTDRFGVYWENKDSDTVFYEWEIGSTDTSSDIFPRVKIGTKNSTKAAVIDGHLWLDGVNINTTVKEYVLRNWTEEEMAEAKSHGNVFNFEPGRCIHVNLYSVNQAHLSSRIPVKPVCMKRKDDIFINFEQEALQRVVAAKNSLKIQMADVLDGDMILKLTFNGTKGGMIVGLLREEDLEEMYGSSASDSYRSFIASPLTKTKTSRLMRNRFHGYSGLSFYISPTGYTKLNDWIDVSMNLNNTQESFVPALIYWDQVSEEWRKITEDCETEETINSMTNTYSAKICLPLQIPQRQRRSIDISSEVDGPRQFSLVFISKDITETQPVIKTDSLTYSEDEANVELKLIDYYDAEDDSVSFRLIGYPKHGFANITSDGKLYYKPDADFSGNDEVIVECTETSLPHWEMPRPVHARVNIFVSEVNDAPDLLFLRANDTFTGDRVNEIVLPMESNSTGYFIGTFFASDIDLNDSLTELVFDTSPSEANLSLYELQDPYLLEMFNSSNKTAAETIKLFQLELSMSKDFFGVIEYGLIVHDNAGHWSLPIKLSIGVLYNPCVFGYCAPREHLLCTDFARAKSFDSFQCECEAGYEGVWCETETNECSSEPCASMFDCEDLVAGYQCNINILKLLAALVCSLLALTVGVVSIICCRKRFSGKMKLSDMEQRKTAKDKCSPFDPGNAKFTKMETEAGL